ASGSIVGSCCIAIKRLKSGSGVAVALCVAVERKAAERCIKAAGCVVRKCTGTDGCVKIASVLSQQSRFANGGIAGTGCVASKGATTHCRLTVTQVANAVNRAELTVGVYHNCQSP